MKMAVFWVVVPCRLVWTDFTHCPNDGGSTDLLNIGELIPVYMELQPRRQPFSCHIKFPFLTLLENLVNVTRKETTVGMKTLKLK
jgi:hypothetical protein